MMPLWAIRALASIAVLATIAGTVYWQHRTIRRLEDERASAVQKAQDADKAYRKQEQDWKQRTQEVENAHRTELATIEGQVQSLRLANAAALADAQRLRDAIGKFATPDVSEDSLPACRGRASALGQYLASGADVVREGLGVVADLAAGYARCNADLKAVISSWPQ